MKKCLILNSLLTIVFLSSFAFSQQTTEISAEKKAVISEIIVVTKADVQSKEIVEKMFAQMEAMYPVIMDSLIEKREGLSEAQKAKMKSELVEKNASFTKKFNQKFLGAINFQDYINEVFYPLYDKFFTVEELKQLLAFYKSPVGQKFNSIMPEFSAESVKMAQNYLVPKIDGIVKDIMNEEFDSVEAKKVTPAPKSNQR